jgi:hypothetical protein
MADMPQMQGAFLRRPPGMAGMQETQEHFLAAAMDGRHAANAGAFSRSRHSVKNHRGTN